MSVGLAEVLLQEKWRLQLVLVVSDSWPWQRFGEAEAIMPLAMCRCPVSLFAGPKKKLGCLGHHPLCAAALWLQQAQDPTGICS